MFVSTFCCFILIVQKIRSDQLNLTFRVPLTQFPPKPHNGFFSITLSVDKYFVAQDNLIARIESLKNRKYQNASNNNKYIFLLLKQTVFSKTSQRIFESRPLQTIL